MTTTVTVRAAPDKTVNVLVADDANILDDKEVTVAPGESQDFTIYGSLFLVISERQEG